MQDSARRDGQVLWILYAEFLVHGIEIKAAVFAAINSSAKLKAV